MEQHEALISRVLDVIEKHSDDCAVAFEGNRYSYKALGYGVRAVASLIREGNANHVPEKVVLLLRQNEIVLPAIYGVLSVGAAYIPIDLRDEESLIKDRIKEVEPDLIITDPTGVSLAQCFGVRIITITPSIFGSSQDAGTSPSTSYDPVRPAYILFTTGTSGRQKGVIQDQGGALRNADAYAASVGGSSRDVFSLIPNFCYDAAVMDMFGAHSVGACLSIYDTRSSLPDLLAPWVIENSISVLHLTPTLFRMLCRHHQSRPFSAIRTVVLGGEPATRFDLELFKRSFRRGAILINGLGPTECTIALQAKFSHDDEIDANILPVGFPVPGAHISLFGDSSADSGRIRIESDRVATGYLRPEIVSTSSFMRSGCSLRTNLFIGSDVLRRSENGEFSFLGRSDGMLKIRGIFFDQELVQDLVRGVEGIIDCHIIPVKLRVVDQLVCAYKARSDFNPRQLQAFQATDNTALRFPIRFVELGSWKTMPNGKIDRKFVEEQVSLILEANEERLLSLASSDPYTVIKEVFKFVLMREDIGDDEDFFDIGGDSLQLEEILLFLDEILQMPLSSNRFSRRPTINGVRDMISLD